MKSKRTALWIAEQPDVGHLHAPKVSTIPLDYAGALTLALAAVSALAAPSWRGRWNSAVIGSPGSPT